MTPTKTPGCLEWLCDVGPALLVWCVVHAVYVLLGIGLLHIAQALQPFYQALLP